jgi:hypothetical protein
MRGVQKASRSAPIEISGGHSFRQSGTDAVGSKASQDMVLRDIGISGGHRLGDGDAGGKKGRGG